jgi:serine/threonine protein phosphatase PrpC
MIWTQLWAATHTGSVRRRNEDSYGATDLVSSQIDGDVATTIIAGESCLAAVADGLGGHPCGDLASRLAIENLLAAKLVDPDELEIRFHEANELVYAEMEHTDRCIEMGTTLSAVLVHEGGVAVVNIGDSPVFEFVDGRLIKLSVDDVPSGQDDLPGLPSFEVTQTIGGLSTPTPIEPNVYEDDELADRIFLLCSDGLTNFVPRSQIADALALGAGQAAVERLIELAIAAGGQDNITVVVMEVQWIN